MFTRFTIALPVSLFISFLHVGCCLLPLLLAGFGSFYNFHLFAQYKTLFTVTQIALLLYLAFRVLKLMQSGYGGHNRVSTWTYLTSFVVVSGALYVGIAEPLQTEEQRLARQRFEYFKNHGKVKLKWENKLEIIRLASDLKAIDGVRPATVKVGRQSAYVSFSKDQTSEKKILSILQSKGYPVKTEK